MKNVILICSVAPPNYVGGLAAYIMTLGKSIESHTGYDVIFGSVYSKHPTLTASGELPNAGVWRAKRPEIWNYTTYLLQKLAPRPKLFTFLKPVISGIQFLLGFPPFPQHIKAIHFVGTGWDFWGIMLVKYARLLGVPFSIWPAIHPGNWGDDAIDIYFYKQAHVVFCQSDHEQRHLAACGVPMEKMVRSGLPPMCQREGDGQRLRGAMGVGDAPTVLFMGRRDVGKGYPALLDAWRQVIDVCPLAVLMLAGPGEMDAPRLERLPTGSFLDLGVPNEQQKADALAACDFFCLPSAHESFGIVYVEAWSYGKPVICGTAPASRELVEDGVTGLWSNQDPTQLASHLLRLLQCPEQAKQMGEAGKRIQRERFTVNAMMQTHLEAWNLLPA